MCDRISKFDDRSHTEFPPEHIKNTPLVFDTVLTIFTGIL